MDEIPSKRQRNRPSRDFKLTRDTRKTTTTFHTRENIRQNITHLYGEGIHHDTKTFEKLCTKRTRLLCDLAFLKNCRDQHLIPNCCKLKFHTKTSKLNRILDNASYAIIRERIYDIKKRLNTNDHQLYKLRLRLSNVIHPSLWSVIDTLAEFRSETDFSIRTERQKAKVSVLLRKQQNTLAERHQDGPTIVHNLSDKLLTPAAEKALAKGFNFAIAPSRIPVENIICGVEKAITELNADTAEILRQETTSILRKSKPPKKNISGEELRALRDLRKDRSIIVLPADKGNATVVLNSDDYHQKMLNLLNDPSYKAITSDPTTYLEKTTKSAIKASSLSEETKKKLIPREKSSRCPKMYGLPKVHKQGAPLRPIVSSFGSPTQALAKHLAMTLQPHVEKAASYVKNSQHFIQIIKNMQLEKNDLLVSFDVVSLFTQVPVTEALSIIETKYNLPEYVISLSKHCLANTYFVYSGQKYKQIEGAPMGSPLSPALANLYMEHFETLALETAPHKPKTWLRYVDDTFVVWQHGEDNLNKFLEHLNNIHPNIKFTMEREVAEQLPFLDVLLQRKLDGSLSHSVYRKPTHTNRYLNASSHHHPAQLFSVAKSLAHRSETLTDKEHLQQETKLLRNVLLSNGYSQNTIRRALNKQHKQERKTYTTKAFLPYIKGITDKIGRLLGKHQIETIYTTNQKIKDILPTPKDIIALEDQGVYEIPCQDCGLSYIGQTNRKISARRDEHKNAVKQKSTTSSLAQHAHNTGHKIDFDKTRTLQKSNNLSTRVIKEAIEIEKRPNNLNNRDDSQRLPNSWKHILSQYQVQPRETIIQPYVTSPTQTLQRTTGPTTRSQSRASIGQIRPTNRITLEHIKHSESVSTFNAKTPTSDQRFEKDG